MGEEYCSIIPVKSDPDNKLLERFPSISRRVLLCILNVSGPYIVNKLLRRFEQPFTDYVVARNTSLQERIADPDSKLSFWDILKVNLLNLVPDIVFSSSHKNFNQLHLALFFVWGRYYEVAKRLTQIIYKYEQGLEGQHGITYLRPGRIIMLTLVI